MTSHLEPKLAVVLHADVVGSTAMVQDDAVLAHERIVNALRNLAETVNRYGGTAHEVRGDALLAVFSRASDALAAALCFQMGNTEPDGESPALRIGMSLGEIVIADGTLTGADVVRAQRLEQLAGPGGVCISDNVRQSVPSGLPYKFESLGGQILKGFDEPVGAHLASVGSPGVVPLPADPRDTPATGADFDPVDQADMAFALPDEPSVAVLAFVGIGAAGDATLVGEGLAETLINVLASLPKLFVIGRASSFKYDGRSAIPAEVSADLGVRYVITGSVQSAGERLRITIRLDDAIDGRTVWSDRLDATTDDLFDVQDIMSRRVAENLQVKLSVGVQAHSWAAQHATLDQFVRALQARAHFQRWTPEGNANAERMWRELAADHPQGTNETGLSIVHWQRCFLGVTNDPAAEFAKARELGLSVLSRWPDHAETHQTLAVVTLALGDFTQALGYSERALALAPGASDVTAVGGFVHIMCGKPHNGVALLRRSMRLAPDYPSFIRWSLRTGLMMMGEFAEARAIAYADLSAGADDPTMQSMSLRHLAAIAAFRGEDEEARTFVARLRALDPDATAATVRERLGPCLDEAFVERYINGLRSAGLS